MRGYLNIAGKAAAANVQVVDVRDPQYLVSRDLDAYAVVRTYQRALTEGNTGLVESLRNANPDLLPYFKHSDRQWLEQAESQKGAEPVPAV